MPDKLPRRRSVGRCEGAPRLFRLRLPRNRSLSPILFQCAGDEIHRRTAEKSGHEKIDRLVVKVERRVGLLHDAVVHDHDPVAHRHRFDLVVRDVNHRRLQSLMELGDFRPHLHPHLGVEI